VVSRTGDVDTLLAPLRAQIERGMPHEEEFGFFATLEGVDGLFVDAGANIGQSAVSLRCVNRSLRILSFEPNPMLEPVLRRVRDELLPRFDYRMTGLSDRQESKVLFVPVIDDLLVTPLATLDPSLFDRPHFQEQLEGLALNGTYDIERVTVQLEALDAFDLEPAVVKIDAEEHEVSCLRGMLETIRRCRPIFMIELNSREAEITTLLGSLGYRRFAFDPEAGELVSSVESLRPVNLFYVHRDDPAQPASSR